MKKKLPFISIKAVGKNYEQKLDSLIKIEPILVMLGYDKSDESWNNNQMKENDITNMLASSKHDSCGYYNHSGIADPDLPKIFPASDIESIINYVTNYK